MKKNKTKQKSYNKCKLLFKIFTYLLILIFVGAAYIYNESCTQRSSKEVVINIKKNSTIKQIALDFEKAEIIQNKNIFILYSLFRIYTSNKKIHYGEYRIDSGSNIVDIFDKLSKHQIITYSYVIPEGFTNQQICKLLNMLNLWDTKDINEVLSQYSEGDFLPETYFYEKNTPLKNILKRMKDDMIIFTKFHFQNRDKKIDNAIHNINELLVLASIVEKEAISYQDKRIVSGIYINRLNRKMRLQADPTIQYSMYKENITVFNTKINSEYNTYIIKGLPPKPICNPGKESILAVLHPIYTEYLYFVFDMSGNILYAKNFEEHKKNILIINKRNSKRKAKNPNPIHIVN